ncbi:lymphotactin-like isoform X1 [Vombatus ursinus]|uniref:Chemokine interleukin-8-like domain-containing protein n=1 Tax=Vombatus ursinus TaxID=29139 RepID=A0A4X2K7G6_VOMUR|nr:lymphotactin-like isoform X1 [Vombatus ursinus]
MKLFLLALICFYSPTACVVEGVGSEVIKKSFCVSWSQPLQSKRVKSYAIDEGPMTAVIFITCKGFKICADPEANWVKNVMNSVDRRTTTRKATRPTASQPPTNKAILKFGLTPSF